MPRIRPLTEAARKAEAQKIQQQRVARIIGAAAEACGYDRQRLADKSGMNVQALNRRMRGELDFRSMELCCICDALRLDDQSRAAIGGSKTKCRFEQGFKL